MKRKSTDYDTIIVGAGPSGLCLATYMPGRILVLEREAQIGGVHKVRRDVEGYFAEHGPRVYSGSFANFKRVLKDIGMSWDEVFVRCPFSPNVIDGRGWTSWLTAREVFVLVMHFLALLFNPSHGKDMTMQQVCHSSGFSERSTWYIDSVCRFSDGAGIDRYSLHEFLSMFNDHFRGFYEPREANDVLLFPRWRRFLERRGVRIMTSTLVDRVEHSGGRATGVRVWVGTEPRLITARRVVMAIPPENAEALLRRSGLEEPGLRQFAQATKYDEYFCVTYHFPTSAAPLVRHEGIHSTPWGLVYMEMSRFTKGEDTAFVSVAASRLNVRSPHTGKSAHQSTRNEAVAEIFRQLPIGEATKRTLIKAVPSSCLARSNNMWVNTDKAYIYNARHPVAWPFDMTRCRGLHMVGCQNGHSWYAFTSLEAAVCNALTFMGRPQKVPIRPVLVLRVLLVALVLVWLLRRVRVPRKVRANINNNLNINLK